MHHLLVTHSYKKSLVALGLTLLCLPITTHAQIRSELTRSSFETTLSNGLQVIIREDHRSPMDIQFAELSTILANISY
jgi:zinc protease